MSIASVFASMSLLCSHCATHPVVDPSTPDEPFATVESTVKALYEVISGPKAQARNWERFASLFHESAKLGVIVQEAKDAKPRIVTLTPEAYRKSAEPYFASEGFFEREISAKREVFGGIAQVFSTYESRRSESDEKPFDRGINSIQMAFDGKRWWITSLIWQPEKKWLPIPNAYLPKKGGGGQ